MSSISGSDRARQTDELRRMREEYENQEAQTAKKTKKQVRRIQEKNTDEVKNLKAAYEERLDAIREKSRSALSAKDENHAAQTEKIRDMYHEQLRRKTEENEQSMGILRETTKSETEKTKLIAQQQREGLENNFKTVVKQKDQEFQTYAEDARDTIQSSIAERTEKLNKRHSQEMEAVSADRDRRIVELQSNGGKQKTYLEEQLRDRDRQHRSEKKRMEDNYMTNSREQSIIMNEALTGKSEILQSERDSLRQDFRGRIDDETQRFDELREQLKDQSAERVDRQVRSVENELRRVKLDSQQQALSGNRLRQLEQKHLVEQYEKRIKDLEQQRNNTRELMTDINRKRIGEMGNKSGDILQAANRQSRMNQEMLLQRAREDRANLESEMKTRLESTQEHTEKRVGNIREQSRASQLAESQYYNENLNQLKGSYADQLAEQRQAQLETLTNIRVDMKEKLKMQESKAQSRLETVVSNFEEKIKSLQESHKQEIANLKKNYESRMGQRDQGHKIESQQVIQKYEMRLSAAQEAHQREMDRLQQRNEQAMADLANRTNFKKKV